MLNEVIQQVLNRQISEECFSSHLYQLMVAYFLRENKS